MSFDIDSFADIGGQTRKGMSPALWSYDSLDDSLADILTPLYFEDIGLHVSRGDFISVSLVDGKSIITVQSQTMNPPGVVIDPEVFAPGGGGNVTTSDVLLATQLVLGNGGVDLVTEPALTFNAGVFGVDGDLDIAATGKLSFDGTIILQDNGGISLMNIGIIDSTTKATIQDAMTSLDNLAFIGGASGDVTGPSGSWMSDGYNAGPGDGFLINFVPVIDDTTSTITLRNIAALDATTLATIQAGVGNVTTSDVLTNNRLLLGNGLSDIKIESGLSFVGGMLGVGAGLPDAFSPLHVFEDTTSTLANAGVTIEQAGGGHALLHFKRSNIMWTIGLSGGNVLQVKDSASIGTGSVLTLTRGTDRMGINKPGPLTTLHITSENDDTAAVVTKETTGTNSASTREFVGDRNPNGAVNGLGSDEYSSRLGALSGSYESRSPIVNTVWFKRSVNPPNIVELHNSAELDDLASGGIITIASNTTWHVKAALTTANRIVVNSGILFRITGEFNATASITYSGTDTFITAPGGNVQIYGAVSINSSSTGTFFVGTTNLCALVIQSSSVVGWIDLGSITDGQFFAANSACFNCTGGFTLTNTVQVNLLTFNQLGTALDGPFFTINTNNPNSIFSFTDVAGQNLGTGSIFDIDTRVHPDVAMNISRCAAPGADLFKQTVLTDATINSVADGSPATGTLTAMADNGSGGTTVSSTTTYFEDEEVTLSGTTNYNDTYQIFNVVAGVSFDIIEPFVGDDATGSVDSVRLTLALAGGHGISTGDSLKIIDTNFYNGFETALNVVSDDLTVNGAFISTNTGAIERELSLDQSDPRIIAFLNSGFSASVFIACAHVNDNSTVNPAIVNGVFRDMLFGTVGDALLASSTMERWKLVDELLGIFEYIGLQPFEGSITFDFTVMSSGGTTDFRFKWQKDVGAGFVDLPDNVEALVAVGSDAQGVSKTFPINAVKGDRIMPNITRNSGSSTITTTYATVYVGM